MSEQIAETPAPPASETPGPDQLPADHPLVRTLAEQKKAIKELKAKASRLDELEEAQKSEAEKAADRIKQLEAEVSASKLGATRFQIAAEFSLNEKQSAALAHVSSEEGMRELAEAFKAESDTRKTNTVPREGKTSSTSGDDEVRQFASGLFKRSE